MDSKEAIKSLFAICCLLIISTFIGVIMFDNYNTKRINEQLKSDNYELTHEVKELRQYKWKYIDYEEKYNECQKVVVQNGN